MKLLKKITVCLSALLIAPLTLAHPGHGAGGASEHVHFSVISLAVVGAVLAVYFALAHKRRARARARREQQDRD